MNCFSDILSIYLRLINTNQNMNDVIYTVEEVAQKLNANVQTIRGLLNKGEMKGYKKLRKWYVLHSDLLTYITSETK